MRTVTSWDGGDGGAFSFDYTGRSKENLPPGMVVTEARLASITPEASFSLSVERTPAPTPNP